MINIAIVVGTRPEAIKLIPVHKVLVANDSCNVHLVSTGQHEELINPLWDLFNVSPDSSLNILKDSQTRGLGELTATLIDKLDQLLRTKKFDCIIVQGDTTTSMVASLVGYYHKTKIAHVEAGLRTGLKYSPFPEEVNRKMISTIADFHFAPTQQAKENLNIENSSGEIHVTGNTGIDSLAFVRDKVRSENKEFAERFAKQLDGYKDLVLITGHRRENLGGRFEIIFDALVSLAKKYRDIGYIYPVHLNPMVRNQVNEKLKGIANIHLIKPVRYDEMVYLMDVSRLIMTDSGGIQEEGPFLNKPIIVLRESTERPEAVAAGCSLLAGSTVEDIIYSFEEVMFNDELYQEMSLARNPYGDGKAGLRIAEILIESLSE